MIIDDVKIKVSAGKGGNGLVAFSKVRFSPGPTGGSGGRGGDIYLEGTNDITALRQFRFKKDIKAEDGENGKIALNDGANADDLVLLVPTGTVCHNITLKKDFEITKSGQRELIARGGRGGRGNYLFRSSTNTSPKQSEQGSLGESFDLRLELKILADVGIIGLPNVGKSSLLNELTRANSKVADYQFTTLEPNLGVYKGLILADIPGLIKGASLGKGLGVKFLRHIERTKSLFHLISAESESPVSDYKIIRKELHAYSNSLLEKPEYIFISKSDSANEKIIKKIKTGFKKIDKKIRFISIIDEKSIEDVKKILDSFKN
jgi:GTP-binding protein